MKIIHTSDLHLGKVIFDYDCLADQKKHLRDLLDYAESHEVEAILIAGDVFDQINPSNDALQALDDFFVESSKKGIHLFIISGNHDSALRLDFGSRIFEFSNIHIVSGFSGKIEHYDLKNAQGKTIRLHLLPFIRKNAISASIKTMEEAFDLAMENLELLDDGFNVLVAHQFFMGGKISEDEYQVGDLDRISTHQLDQFDYCALGHLHGPQKISPTAYYSGTLMKYSAAEEHHKKGFYLLDFRDDLQIEKIEVRPIRDIITIKGEFKTLCDPAFVKTKDLRHFYRFILEDTQPVYEPKRRLQELYPNIIGRVEYAHEFESRTSPKLQASSAKNPAELISDFFETVHEKKPSDLQRELIDSIWEDLYAAD